MAFKVPVMQDIIPPRSPLRHPEMALIKLWRHLAMLLQMLLRQEKMAPMAAASDRKDMLRCESAAKKSVGLLLDHIQTIEND